MPTLFAVDWLPLRGDASPARTPRPLWHAAALEAVRLLTSARWAQALPLGRYVAKLEEATFDRVRAAADRLDPELARTEQEFLSFGRDLSRLSDACQEVVHCGEHLFGLATGHEQGEQALTRTLELLEDPLHYIADAGARSVAIAAASRRAQESARKIIDAEPALARALKPLVYIRTLFHVESAQLPAEVRQMFAQLSGEIEALQTRVTERFGARFEELRYLHRALAEFGDHYGLRTEALASGGQAQQQALRQSLELLRQSIYESAQLDHGLAQITSGLAADVNAMVVAMQAHDMVCQRMAHVRQGLDLIRSEFAQLSAGNLGQARCGLPNLAAVARLQATQIRSTQEQLAGASASLGQSVNAVATRIRQLDEDCLMLKDYRHITASATGTVQVLLDALEKTCRMVEEISRTAQSCCEPLKPLRAAAAGLSGEIDHAGEQMRRIALNTQLAAVHQGSGTGLEVLAGTMASTASEISRTCTQAEAELRTLMDSLTETLEGFDGIVSQGAQVQERLGSAAHEQETLLHVLRDETFAALDQVGESVEATRGLAAEMTSFDLDGLCRGLLPELEAAVSEAAGRAEDLCDRLRAEAIHPLQLDSLADKYTMQLEREVHAECFGTEGGAVADSGLGPNVDLF